jgi:hypothetical protein
VLLGALSSPCLWFFPFVSVEHSYSYMFGCNWLQFWVAYDVPRCRHTQVKYNIINTASCCTHMSDLSNASPPSHTSVSYIQPEEYLI